MKMMKISEKIILYQLLNVKTSISLIVSGSCSSFGMGGFRLSTRTMNVLFSLAFAINQ